MIMKELIKLIKRLYFSLFFIFSYPVLGAYYSIIFINHIIHGEILQHLAEKWLSRYGGIPETVAIFCRENGRAVGNRV